jgi:hypothetical protein
MNLNELPLEHELLTDRNIAIKLVGVGGAPAPMPWTGSRWRTSSACSWR